MKSRIIWSLFFLMCVGMVAFVSRSLFLSYRLKDSPNVLIITMDTTRADHLGCYGYDKIKTPHIDSVAREGVLFEEAFTVQPVTLPSHCSIFTGVYPFRHGVRDNNSYKLGDQHLTLGEILAKKGYLTAAFISSIILDKRFGLNQGFSFYSDTFLKPIRSGLTPITRQAVEVSLQSCKWLDANKKKLAKQPFFLWLHYYDPHAMYNPPSPYLEECPSLYDGEIAYMDEWIGYMINKLKLSNLWDNTIVVIVADHGESLGEHSEKTHGIFIYRSTTQVPLIFKYPNSLHAGQHIKQRVSIVDIMPTILNMLRIKKENTYDGKSLSPLIENNEWDKERPIYIETFLPRTFNWSDIKGIRKGRYFLIDAPRSELYLDNELDNLIDLHPVITEKMKSTLETMLTDAPHASAEHVILDEQMIKKLSALGYFVSGSRKAVEDDLGISRPDPKDKISLIFLYHMASNMRISGAFGQALKIYETILKFDPDNPKFLMETAQNQIEQKRYAAAEKNLIHALSVTDKNVMVQYLFGLCYEKWDKENEALDAYKKALTLDEEYFMARFRIGMIFLRTGRWKEAEQEFIEANRILPYDALTLNNLGYIAILARNDLKKGIELIERALEIEPDNPSILGCLGWAYHNAKQYKKAATYLEAAISLDPDNKLFIKQLKEVYKKLGDNDKLQALVSREKIPESKQ